MNRSPSSTGSAAALDAAADRLATRVSGWSGTRWAALAASGATSRAALVYALVQRLADAGADAEGEPRRTVPHLATDLALPDQLRVVVGDLLAAAATGAPGAADVALRRATDDIEATSAAL